MKASSIEHLCPKRSTGLPTTVLVGAALVGTACGSPHVPPEGVPQLFESVEAAPQLYESALDGCVELHHVWKAQVRAVHRTARGSVGDRVRMLVDSARTPYAEFWDGYVSDRFARWARREFDLAGDSRSAIPTRIDLLDLIEGATVRVEAMTGRRGCAEWYLVYGPGWANLGGLSDGKMLIDFYGLPTDGGIEELRRTVPHEVAHLIDNGSLPDPDRGSVLASIVGEGLATYFADVYWGNEMTPAEALGYSEGEWEWAVTHEAELWSIASAQLEQTDPAVINEYRMAGAHLVPEGPGKIGYFLGYRIAEAYVSRHGEASLADLFELPVRQILDGSGYAR